MPGSDDSVATFVITGPSAVGERTGTTIPQRFTLGVPVPQPARDAEILHWDGCGAHGFPVPTGIYICRVTASTWHGEARIFSP